MSTSTPDERSEVMGGGGHAGSAGGAGGNAPRGIEDVFERARELWPGIAVPVERLAAFVADRGATGELRPDVVLACACLDADPAALAAFEQRLLAPVAARLRADMGNGIADEAIGRLRETLFVSAPGGTPKLASYSGRGELRGWLEVVARREAYKVARQELAGPGDDHILDGLPDDDDLELRQIKSQHRSELGRAFADALAALPARERLILRQRYLDGLTFDEVGAIHGVHRITVMRWLARIEKQLLREIRRSLVARLRLGESEVDQLVEDARSRLDLSLRGLLEVRSVAS
jgi:RNA polymerase sigma-70 factor, ECF subfamily